MTCYIEVTVNDSLMRLRKTPQRSLNVAAPGRGHNAAPSLCRAACGLLQAVQRLVQLSAPASQHECSIIWCLIILEQEHSTAVSAGSSNSPIPSSYTLQSSKPQYMQAFPALSHLHPNRQDICVKAKLRAHSRCATSCSTCPSCCRDPTTPASSRCSQADACGAPC